MLLSDLCELFVWDGPKAAWLPSLDKIQDSKPVDDIPVSS